MSTLTDLIGGQAKAQQSAITTQNGSNATNFPFTLGSSVPGGVLNSTWPLSSGGGTAAGGTGQAIPVQPVSQEAIDAMRQQQVTDPYAQWGGSQGYARATGQVDSALNNLRTGAGGSFDSARLALQGYGDTAYNTLNNSQTDINNGRANNELNRMNSIQDILGYVRNGLQQGGSRLAASNATESSATGALQRAYNQIGSQKTRSVNNQAGIQSAQLDQSQSKQAQAVQTTIQDFHNKRDQYVNDISNGLRDQLAQLDQTAQGLNLAGRIQVDQEKQALIDANMAKLQEVDQWLQGKLSSIAPISQDQIQAQAYGLQQAGTQLSNPFTQQFDQQQVQGAPLDQLPLMVRNKKIL